MNNAEWDGIKICQARELTRLQQGDRSIHMYPEHAAYTDRDVGSMQRYLMQANLPR